jgi:hypothetical protein
LGRFCINRPTLKIVLKIHRRHGGLKFSLNRKDTCISYLKEGLSDQTTWTRANAYRWSGNPKVHNIVSQIEPTETGAQCCTVLYCTVLYSTVLYCTALYCTVLYCTVQCCTVQHCTVLYCTALYCTVLYCTVQCCSVQHCTVLYCTAQYY